MTTFENIRVFTSSLGDLKHGAAFALPAIGIFVNPTDVSNIDLLRHEFGHMLQARLWGHLFFYSTVVPVSVASAHKANATSYDHQHTWTEWSANLLSYKYFKAPANWNMKRYPVSPPVSFTAFDKLPKRVRLLIDEK